MLLRRLIFGMGLVTILGCSGSTSLIVRNLMDKPISGNVQIQTSYAKKKSVKTSDFALEPGGGKETVNWFKEGPDWLKFEYSVDGQKATSTEFLPKNYPSGMMVGTTAGAWYYLEVRETGLNLRAPTQWEIIKRNPQYTILQLGFLLAVAALIIWIVRSDRKRRARHNLV